MEHYFGNIAILHNLKFPNASKIRPQKSTENLSAADLILNQSDIEALIDDYVFLAMQIAQQYFAFFKFLDQHLQSNLTDEHIEQLKVKTQVIPLPALHRNETHYKDALEIMRYYVRLVERLFSSAGISNVPKVHIGGDLLTRVMQSGCKLLMIKAPTPADRFDCLSPISAEFFHMAMKLLGVIMKRLWNKTSGGDLGTMRNEQLRTHRNDVGPDVKKSYSEDKEFFLSFTNAHIIEAICTHFQLDDINGTPRQAPTDPDLLYQWALVEFRNIVKSCVGTFNYKKPAGNILSLHYFMSGSYVYKIYIWYMWYETHSRILYRIRTCS